MKNKEAKDLKRKMNFYLAMAKTNKFASLLVYYAGLAAPFYAMGNAFTKDSLGQGIETVLAGITVGGLAIVSAATMQQMNPRILRNYLKTRDELNISNLQQVK